MKSPTQSAPGGCVVALLAGIPGLFLVLGVWGMLKWFQLPAENREVNAYFWAMLVAVIFGGLLSVLLVWFGCRLIRSTDFRGYDSRDPDKTHLKW